MRTISGFDDVTVEAIDRIAVLSLNDPKTMNAIAPRMIGGIAPALEYIDAQGKAFRALVMTGAGKGFCSGANLTTTGPDDMLKQDDFGRILREVYYPVLRRLRALEMPMIVAVNGPAVGF